MDKGFSKQEESNCQCQCHFPNNIICQMKCCCHCVCNNNFQNQSFSKSNSQNIQSNLNNLNCPDYNNRNLYTPNSKGKEHNLNLMSSYSTNFGSGNNSIICQNSGMNNYNNNSNLNTMTNERNYYALRKMQNPDLMKPQKLSRNFSDPKFDINNNSYVNTYPTNIQQESYRNNNNSFYNNDYRNNNNLNNSNLMNDSFNPLNRTSNSINNNNNNSKINLTYTYNEDVKHTNSTNNDNLNNLNNLNNTNNNINFTNNELPNGNLNNNYGNSNNLNNLNNMNKYNTPNGNDNNLKEFKNPIDLNYVAYNNNPEQLKSDLAKAHDLIAILQRENESLKAQRDGIYNQISANENMKNIDRIKCDELRNENDELRKRLNDEIKKNKQKDNYIANLKDQINDLQNALLDKDRQIQDLLQQMRQLEQDANNEIARLKNKIDDLRREKEALIRDFQREINDLNDEIRRLNNLLSDAERKIKELENKIRTMKRFDDKKQKLLETLFNWYNTMNKMLNTNTATGKAPPKDILNDVINLQTIDEFKDKLNQIEDKLSQFISDMKLKFGECFACDIACCTSEVERLKYFRNYYPGPPKDYPGRDKKCKCV